LKIGTELCKTISNDYTKFHKIPINRSQDMCDCRRVQHRGGGSTQNRRKSTPKHVIKRLGSRFNVVPTRSWWRPLPMNKTTGRQTQTQRHSTNKNKQAHTNTVKTPNQNTKLIPPKTKTQRTYPPDCAKM
jgi:hypothetical protein